MGGTSKNPNFCVTLLQQNAHLRQVNSAFVSVASLDIEIFRSPLIIIASRFFIKKR
jgi:hypothetical protein